MPKGGHRPGAGRKPGKMPRVIVSLPAEWLAVMPGMKSRYIREAVKTALESDGLIEGVQIFGGDNGNNSNGNCQRRILK